VLAGTVKPESWNAGKLGSTILWSVIVSSIAIAAFYILH
jgi:hypothetical protein